MATIKGTWVFNNSVFGDGSTYNVNFTYNGISCTKISGCDNPNSSIPIHTGEYLWYYVGGTWVKVYHGGWLGDEYKTINITEEPNDEQFATWLPDNASKQGGGDEEDTPTASIDLTTLGLEAGTYVITVRAKAAGRIASALSKEIQYEAANAVLYAPEISATNNDGQILISDTVNGDNVVSYNVYKSSNNGYVTNVARTGTQTSVYIDNGVSAYVKAVDSSGNESEASNIIKTKECFVAGTPVLMADGTYKMIEEIEAGDKVRSYDISTGEYVEGTVTEVVSGYTNRLAMVLFSDSNYLVMAEGHPLYTLDGWHSITNKDGYPTLVIGDKVLGAYGYVEIVDLQVIDVEPTMVYSLAVSATAEGGKSSLLCRCWNLSNSQLTEDSTSSEPTQSEPLTAADPETNFDETEGGGDLSATLQEWERCRYTEEERNLTYFAGLGAAGASAHGGGPG